MNRRSFLNGFSAIIGVITAVPVAITRFVTKIEKRRLEVSWTCELVQDLECFHDITMDV